MSKKKNKEAGVEELKTGEEFTKQDKIKSNEALEAQVPRIPKNRNYLNQYR
jgi:hypothetical protein